MASKTIKVSDVSGKEIPAKEGAVVTIKFNDARRGAVVLDLAEDELDGWVEKGRKLATRGRPPKTTT